MGVPRTKSDVRHGHVAAWVIGAVALVLVAGIVLLDEHFSRATARDRVAEFNQRRLALANEVAHRVELYFTMLATALRPLAEDAEIARLDPAACRREVKLKSEELKLFGVKDVGIIDAGGIMRYSATAPAVEGSDFSARAYFQDARLQTSTKNSVVGFVDFEGLRPGERGALVGVPFFGPGGEGNPPSSPVPFAGLAGCIVKLDYLAQEFVAPIRPSERGHAFLMDHEGRVLWSPESSPVGRDLVAQSKGFSEFQGVIERMMAGESGAVECPYYRFDESTRRYARDSEQVSIAYAPVRVGKRPWAIGIWAPTEDALSLIQAAHQRHRIVVALCVLVILLGSLCALAISFRLSRILEGRVASKTKELRDAHERLLMVLDSLDAIVCVGDIEKHEVLFVNRAARRLLGDAAGKTCWQTLQSDRTGPCELCPKQDLLDATGEPTGVHIQEIESTATGRTYEVHCRAFRWVDGQMVGLLIAFDITERRRQEQLIVEQGNRLQEQQAQLVAAQERLASATAHVSELVDTAAQEQEFETHYANPSLVACWQARACQKTWCPCHGREPMRCWQVEGTFCDREKPATFAEKVISCRSCEVFRRSCPDRLTELAEGFNNLMFLYARKTEEMRNLRYHAIQRDRMATIGQMAAGIAHEIGNPVASLFSLIHLLKASAGSEEEKGRFALMQQCIERISKIVREIVEFGRPIKSEDWTYGDVEKVVQDTLRLLRYDHRTRNVAVSVEFELGMPKTMLIEHQLQQIFMNVMLNAFDAMHGTGTLTVRGWRTDGAIEVSIADTGEGMLPEQLQHIFEPFYTTKAARKGTGLGLALSYNIVQRHGGSIRVQSEVGKGSTFTVSIPLRKPNGAGQTRP